MILPGIFGTPVADSLPPGAPPGTVPYMGPSQWSVTSVSSASTFITNESMGVVNTTVDREGVATFRTIHSTQSIISSLGFTPSKIFVVFNYSPNITEGFGGTYCQASISVNIPFSPLLGSTSIEPPPSGTSSIATQTFPSNDTTFIQINLTRNNRPLGVDNKSTFLSYVGFAP